MEQASLERGISNEKNDREMGKPAVRLVAAQASPSLVP